MKTVAVICIKGGTGKTTIARELTYGFRRMDLRTSLYGFDSQYASGSDTVDNPEVVVVDTAGGMPTDRTVGVIHNADLIVVPVRPTALDTEPFLSTISFIRSIDPAKPLVIVVNCWNHNNVCRDFCTGLTNAGLVPPADVLLIPQSEAMVRATSEGRSVVGIDRYGRARVAVEALVGHVATKLALKSARP